MRGERARSNDETEPAPDRMRPRGRRAFVTSSCCQVWGVLNVTPDSFSDGGSFLAPDAALAHAARMIDEGADVLDVGGESSRPPGKTYGAGYAAVDADEERRRVVPIIERLREREVGISVDTVKAEVARAALAAGATIVNDVTMGVDDALVDAVGEAGAQLVLMHTRARGRVDAETTAYADVVPDILEELLGAVDRVVARGLKRTDLWIDPGIGFAKTAAQSAAILGNLDAFVATGYPVLVGASRKSFIARTMTASGAEEPPPAARLGGSLAAVTAAAWAGCRAVRVHEVFESVQAARVAEAMVRV